MLSYYPRISVVARQTCTASCAITTWLPLTWLFPRRSLTFDQPLKHSHTRTRARSLGPVIRSTALSLFSLCESGAYKLFYNLGPASHGPGSSAGRAHAGRGIYARATAARSMDESYSWWMRWCNESHPCKSVREIKKYVRFAFEQMPCSHLSQSSCMYADTHCLSTDRVGKSSRLLLMAKRRIRACGKVCLAYGRKKDSMVSCVAMD